jgi:predicted nucleic acid-binding Zn ribbon protein
MTARPCPICGAPITGQALRCSRACYWIARRMQTGTPNSQKRAKRAWEQMVALQPFPRGLLQRVPTKRAVAYLLMQKPRTGV